MLQGTARDMHPEVPPDAPCVRLRVARTTINASGLANLKKLFKTIELAGPI
jgi:hypothetical protein